MALQVNWTHVALKQFNEILDYWDEKNGSKRYSKKIVNLVNLSLLRLAEYPKIGRKTEVDRIRLKIVKNYFLYYSFDSNHLTVLGISDMRRDPKYLRSIIK